MNDIPRQLRAQIPSSTDPNWLERMALAAEGQTYSRRMQCINNQESEGKSPPNCQAPLNLSSSGPSPKFW
jgi:hypothetical protein